MCDALGRGDQSVLLRKGGIHEGRAGFSFKHERFLLFPTRFHAQGEQVRVPITSAQTSGEWETGEEVELSYWCEATWARTLTDWDQVKQLASWHVWEESLVRERFDCGEDQQIHCALVRVYRLAQPITLAYEKKYGGCRTWVDLPDPASGWRKSLEPVLTEEAFAEVRSALSFVEGAASD